MNLTFRRSLFAVIVLSFTLLSVSQISAAGFYVQEQSVLNMGRSYIGQAAAPYDASTVYANPAGMTMLSGPQVTAGVIMIVPSVTSKNTGTTLSGSPVTGGDGMGVYDPSFIPNAYGAMPLRKDLWIGIAAVAPYGLVTSYDHDWYGRYDSIYSSLKIIDIAPSVGYKANDWLSIGGSLNLQHANATLTSDIRVLGLDALSRVEGDSFALGISAGVLIKPVRDVLIGLTYHSQTTHHLRGISSTSIGGTPIAPNSVARAGINTPDIVNLAATYHLTPQLTFLGQVNWFNWSRFKELKIKTDGGTLIRTQNYHDVVSGGVGLEYKWNETWSFRTGYQYDPTPTSDTYRSTSLPDESRHWVSVGLSYNYTPNVTFDLGYSHGFLKPTKIDLTNTLPLSGGTVRTRARIHIAFDIVGAAMRYRF